MSRADAQAIITLAWEKGRRDPRLAQALSTLGISERKFRECRQAAKSVEIRFPRIHVLTPAGMGVRV